MHSYTKANKQRKSHLSENYIDEADNWVKLQHYIDQIPDAHDEVLPGIKWGHFAQLYTPAYWKLQYYLQEDESISSYQLGETLVEEVVACLLGGYGIPAEMGLLAFQRLKEEKLINSSVKEKDILEALKRPFITKEGKEVVYRFFNQKSLYISKFLNRRDINSIPQSSGRNLRDWLLNIEGIGPKTASWIARNWTKTNRVAIIDIHIYRAGILGGFFNKSLSVQKDYFELERQYIAFCKALNVQAAKLDALIWYNMKISNRIAIKILTNP